MMVMISNDAVRERLLATGAVDKVVVDGDGYHYDVMVVSDVFCGLSRVARQQWIYAVLQDWIASGALHALNMKTLTKQEWETKHG